MLLDLLAAAVRAHDGALRVFGGRQCLGEGSLADVAEVFEKGHGCLRVPSKDRRILGFEAGLIQTAVAVGE